MEVEPCELSEAGNVMENKNSVTEEQYKPVNMEASKNDNNTDQTNRDTVTVENVERLPLVDNQQVVDNEQESKTDNETSADFKKPVLLIGSKHGKVSKLKIVNDIKKTDQLPSTEDASKIDKNKQALSNSAQDNESESSSQSPADAQKNIPLSYTEPSWGGIPEKEYKLEVLKSGMIIDTIDLSEKSFYVIGRLPTCDISLAHVTISRYHAIIQYRTMGNDKNPAGLYLYDLGSINGTFWNGNRVKPKMYVRIQGGHMIRFGCSQRKFIVQAPLEDQEEESEFTITELKQQRMLALAERQKNSLLQEEEERLKKEEEENAGIDWGMGEDADEETDLTENPYASTGNEELFLTDPKKTLRGWFEREGHELQYQTEQKGIGQFLCWVNLPVESSTGHPVKAEAIVKGKKKESVIQCALEACRILDRLGLLRQANHEARKKKARNWEEEDYYDSDEDNFLDRTGTVEKKREQRMRQAGKLETKVETYSSLLEKHAEVLKQISHIEKRLEDSRQTRAAQPDSDDEDALDAFMSTLNKPMLNKSDARKMKIELQNLHKEEKRLKDLVNLARPANLPPLTTNPLFKTSTTDDSENTSTTTRQKSIISNIGQRKKPRTTTKTDKGMLSQATLQTSQNTDDKEEEEEEEEDEDETVNKTSDIEQKNGGDIQLEKFEVKNEKELTVEPLKNASDQDKRTEKIEKPEKNISKINKASSKDDKISSKRSSETGTSKAQDAKKMKKEKLEKSTNLDAYREDYSTWLPPQDQTGDGKTSLNAKYGY